MFEQCGSDEELDADDGRRTNSVACLRLVARGAVVNCVLMCHRRIDCSLR